MSKTKIVLDLLEIARNDLAVVDGVTDLSMGDITHLAQLSRIFDEPENDHKFRRWLLDVLDAELRMRTGDESKERGTVILRTEDYSLDELCVIGFQLAHLQAFDTLTKEERTFVRNIHCLVIRDTASRVRTAFDGGCLMDKKEVANMLAIKPQQVIDLVRNGTLKKPIRLKQRILRWHSEDISSALQKLATNRS